MTPPPHRVLAAMSDRDLRAAARAALDRGGWSIRQLRSGHVQLRHVSGAVVHTSATRGGGGRGVANLRAALARAERRA